MADTFPFNLDMNSVKSKVLYDNDVLNMIMYHIELSWSSA